LRADRDVDARVFARELRQVLTGVVRLTVQDIDPSGACRRLSRVRSWFDLQQAQGTPRTRRNRYQVFAPAHTDRRAHGRPSAAAFDRPPASTDACHFQDAAALMGKQVERLLDVVERKVMGDERREIDAGYGRRHASYMTVREVRRS
jgi:hypothetical protein